MANSDDAQSKNNCLKLETQVKPFSLKEYAIWTKIKQFDSHLNVNQTDLLNNQIILLAVSILSYYMVLQWQCKSLLWWIGFTVIIS